MSSILPSCGSRAAQDGTRKLRSATLEGQEWMLDLLYAATASSLKLLMQGPPGCGGTHPSCAFLLSANMRELL